MDRILRRREVSFATGYARSTLYALIKSGGFPAPVKLGARGSGWLASEVEAWIANRKQERDAAGAYGRRQKLRDD